MDSALHHGRPRHRVRRIGRSHGSALDQPAAAGCRPPPAPVEEARPLPVGTIVVAAKPLRYGMELSANDVREVPWPQGALPTGAYKTVAEVLAGNGKRVVLSAIEPNEPVLQPKITGPGQRSTLSALIDDGMGAVTVQVNEVIGASSSPAIASTSS